jgi:Protein of unknown function (DUF3105)
VFANISARPPVLGDVTAEIVTVPPTYMPYREAMALANGVHGRRGQTRPRSARIGEPDKSSCRRQCVTELSRTLARPSEDRTACSLRQLAAHNPEREHAELRPGGVPQATVGNLWQIFMEYQPLPSSAWQTVIASLESRQPPGGKARTGTDWSQRMSRQEQRQSARTARLETVQRQQRHSARRRSAVIAAASLAVVAAMVGGVSWAIAGASGSGSTASGTVPLTGMKTYSALARDHVTGTVAYPQTPPVGGAHSAVWQNCGVYSAPVRNENAVHSLEHGAMWLTYRPGLPPSEIASILGDVSGQPYALVSPYPGLPSPIVATVWGVQLKLSSASDPRLKAFVNTYQSGRQAPEPGGPCTGGTGTPQG